jgi:hypothetical protein
MHKNLKFNSRDVAQELPKTGANNTEITEIVESRVC